MAALAYIQGLAQYTDLTQRHLLAVAILGYMIAAVLGAQLIDQCVIRAQVSAAQPPVSFAMTVKMALQVNRLMGAMKRP
ncbi:hypothetical protein D3C73_1217980 [compost metagenome]